MSMLNMRNNNYLPNEFGDGCFGCSPDNSNGLQMKFEAGHDTVVSNLTVPKHLCGWNGLIHGGVITTILDEIMSWSAIHLLKKLVMTKTMTVDFISPLHVGDQLTAKGQILKVSSRHEAVIEGFLSNSDNEICAKSEGIFATFSPKVAIRLGIIRDERAKWLSQLLSD